MLSFKKALRRARKATSKSGHPKEKGGGERGTGGGGGRGQEKAKWHCVANALDDISLPTVAAKASARAVAEAKAKPHAETQSPNINLPEDTQSYRERGAVSRRRWLSQSQKGRCSDEKWRRPPPLGDPSSFSSHSFWTCCRVCTALNGSQTLEVDVPR